MVALVSADNLNTTATVLRVPSADNLNLPDPIANLPQTPLGLIAEPRDSGALIAWVPPAGVFTGYVLTASAAGWADRVYKLSLATLGEITSSTTYEAMFEASGLVNDVAWSLALSTTSGTLVSPPALTSVTPVDAAPDLTTPVDPVAGLPDPPVLTLVTPGDASLQAEWTAPTWTGGSPILGWEIQAGDQVRTLRDPIARSGAVAGLMNDVAHPVTVRTLTAAGISTDSNSITVTPAAGLPIFEEPIPPPPKPPRVPVPPPSIIAFHPETAFSPDNWAGVT